MVFSAINVHAEVLILSSWVREKNNLSIAMFKSSIFDSASIAFFSLSSLILFVSSYFFSVSSIFFSRELTRVCSHEMQSVINTASNCKNIRSCSIVEGKKSPQKKKGVKQTITILQIYSRRTNRMQALVSQNYVHVSP